MPSYKHKKKKKSHKQSKKHVSSSSDNERSAWKVTLSHSDSDDSKDEERLTSLMPSYKHKKKKKSHKQSKKHVSSSSENERSAWKVTLSNSDSDDSKNEERLTSLVRGSYLNHLHQALTHNFEGWLNNSDELSKDSIQELVNKWCTSLEQKSLRACMISELYRRNMASLIRQIKASTSEGRLYVEERTLSKLKLNLPSSKETQTDKCNVDINKVSVKTQTDPPLTSLLDLPLPKIVACSPSSRPYDPAIDFSDSNSNGAGVSSSLGTKQYESFSISAINQDICNITSTSDLFPPAQFSYDNLGTIDVTNAQSTLDILSVRTDVDSQCGTATENCTAQVIVANGKDSAESEPHDKAVSLTVHKQLNIHKKQRTSLEQVTCNTILKKDNLDARLTAMGLLGDVGNKTENTSSPLPIEKCKKSNWYAEEIAQSCNLARTLLRMSTKQRERVLKKIKELFGEEDETLTDKLTQGNITICRKRIASVVVMELTPIYQAKRIASRHLFKLLAKKFTKCLMEQSYAPDSRSIRCKVKEFFRDGRVVMSQSDCN